MKVMRFNSSSRNQRGAMMGFVIVSIIVLIILAVALFQISLLFGGSRELSNAVDAGTLNTGQKAPTVTVDIQSGGDEGQYSDVAENNGQSFSLKSINRMWAKCLVCLMNQEEMNSDGYSSGQSLGHADQLYTAASSISDRLANKLNDQNSLKQFFTDLVSRETLRMLGNTANVVYEAGPGWTTSLMDRGIESNVAVYQDQLPSGFNFSNVNAVQASDGKNYFKGYTPIMVGSHSVTFVPFRLKSQPHLVSNLTFGKNMNAAAPISQWATPVPNAFSCTGMSQSQRLNTQHCKSYVLTNPQQTFDLTLPHSFIHIKLDKNTSHFYLNGTPFPDQTYDYGIPTVQTAGPMEAGTGTLTAETGVGFEFLPPTIWQALTALPGGDYSKLKNVMTQRCAEMKHGFQESDLESLLGSMLIPGVTDYYIYPDDKGQVQVSPSVSSPVPPTWVLSGGDPDGSEKEICNNDTWWFPNWTFPFLEGIGPNPLPSFTEETDSVNWTAGTGFGGCLGKVRVTHDTTSYCNGVCAIF
jgi:hypothetical protein